MKKIFFLSILLCSCATVGVRPPEEEQCLSSVLSVIPDIVAVSTSCQTHPNESNAPACSTAIVRLVGDSAGCLPHFYRRVVAVDGGNHG